MDKTTFTVEFEALTGNQPFPWQTDLYKQFEKGQLPLSCNIPTGLGKTAIIPIWLIALANCGQKLPRRLVYVVNRRTVVDQATREAEKLRDQLLPPNRPDTLDQLAAKLRTLTSAPDDPNYAIPAISTLRGQFADNREWSADPSRPAIIVGTVDMIGSRLLFSGYRIGFKSRPLHAGFLGQDVLLVHDEAHLEPAFQDLLIAIKKEQERCREFQSFHVMELSATSRRTDTPLTLTEADKSNPEVKNRYEAKKSIHLHEIADEKKLSDKISDLALNFKETKQSVLIFVRLVEDVEKIMKKLPDEHSRQLTGTLRGFERDRLVNDDIFRRFLPGAAPGTETVYLVCTSAGEVGVNISADHLICDLSTFESMAQRFGRVNRFGHRDDTQVHVVHPKDFDEKSDWELCRKNTL